MFKHLGLVRKQLPVSGRGQSHFRCAKIGTVLNLLLDGSLAFRGAALLVCAIAASLSGCISLDISVPDLLGQREELAVMPDGSGKLTVTWDMLFEDPEADENKKAAAEIAASFRDAPTFQEETFKGAVAYEEECGMPQQGALVVVCTAYFDDVNQFQHRDLEAWTTYRFEKLPRGFALEVNDPDGLGFFEELAAWGRDVEKDPGPYWTAIAEAPVEGEDPEGAKRAAKAFAQRVLKGPLFSGTYTLPGDVKEAKGFTSIEGRTVSFVLAWKELEGLEDADLAAELEKTRGVRRIVCGPSSVSQEEIAAFQRELAEAKREHGLPAKD